MTSPRHAMHSKAAAINRKMPCTPVAPARQPRLRLLLRQGALITLIVHWPVACTLNDSASAGVTPVISVLPDPDVAMSFGRLPPKAFGSVAEIEKLVAPPMLGSAL